MRQEMRGTALRDLEDDLRVFRGKSVRRTRWGWLRGVRQATGMPVAEVGRRMGVGTSEVFRMEVAEEDDRITLGKLRAAAEALGCDLVYAVVPQKGRTMMDLAKDAAAVKAEKTRETPKRGPRGDRYHFMRTVLTLMDLAGWQMGRGWRKGSKRP